jgi:hypothetical protein
MSQSDRLRKGEKSRGAVSELGLHGQGAKLQGVHEQIELIILSD